MMTDATQAFYGRWARVYDWIATAPGVRGWRERAADALALAPGATVVEMGCGTGANLAALRRRVGPSGRVVGVDLTREMLTTARARVDRNAWDNVHLVRADARCPPVSGGVDAVLATFVSGMLGDPGAAVREWVDRLVPGGRIVLLDAAPTTRAVARPLNLPFAVFVWASSPRKGSPRGTLGRLADRVETARHTLIAETRAARTRTTALGFVRVTAGTRPG